MPTLTLLLAIPSLAGALTLLVRRPWLGRIVLLVVAAFHLVLTASTWIAVPESIASGWLQLDQLGILFLTTISVLFAASSIYAVGYLSGSAKRLAQGENEQEHARVEAIFVSFLLFYLATMTLVTMCYHYELLWVGIEATTLVSAPLIYFHRNQHSIEATWKYLMICSFGIALALLGNFFLSISASGAGGSLAFTDLMARAHSLDPAWLKIAFIFLFVGYGTKMGLAPMHTWLPDAHSEAPSLVSALLSGCSLNCAFLGILRGFQLCSAAGHGDFARPLLIGFGLLSMAFAGVFIIRQADFKRMLAYSSVEHMGVLALAVGLGGQAVFGGMLHLLNHSLIKAMLFLVAGNILIAYQSKSTETVRGALRALPVSGFIWFLGFFAISGFPPFGIFSSELVILKGIIDQSRWVIAILYLLFLSVVFFGFSSISMRMLLGSPGQRVHKMTRGEWPWAVAPPIALAVIVVVIGPHLPHFIWSHLDAIAHLLGDRS